MSDNFLQMCFLAGHSQTQESCEPVYLFLPLGFAFLFQLHINNRTNTKDCIYIFPNNLRATRLKACVFVAVRRFNKGGEL